MDTPLPPPDCVIARLRFIKATRIIWEQQRQSGVRHNYGPAKASHTREIKRYKRLWDSEAIEAQL